ncbi:hypothetical protein LCGC14_2977190 [marine sediment metagenome]|uniref:Uncharacterized protein n=1 Tax=marine sediment metagenome TaxID=412755 RepID=A0A0F8ZYX2_9ZZZZ
MIEQLKAQIKVVVAAREMTQRATAERIASYEKWVEVNQPLLDNESTAKIICQEVESALRELTLQAYAETGNKSPAHGVGIREVTKLEYDVKVALDWAVEHTMALKLDSSAFEKIAKVSPPDFVHVSQVPQATIASQLEEEE